MLAGESASLEYVGRQKELALLLERWNDSASRSGAALVVLGDEGIGKSRLVERFIGRAGAEATVVQTFCAEHLATPYGPILEIARALLGEGEGAELSALASRQAGDQPQSLLAGSFCSRLEAKAQERRVLLSVDDAHWADGASLALLELLTRRRPSRVCVVLTWRKGAAAAPLARIVRAGASLVPIEALPQTDMRYLAARVFANGQLNAEEIGQICELAEGNPLYAEELVRSRLERSGDTSRTVHASVLARLDEMPEGDQRILLRAAVIGRHFEVDLLARTADETVERVLEVLRKARNKQLVREHPEPHRFAFHHSMIRDVLYREMLVAENMLVHTKIATDLEAQPPTPTRDAELAYHWGAARVADKAIAANERAGDAAIAVFAYADAGRWYRAALDFGVTDARRRSTLWEKLAGALCRAGISDRTREAFEAALAGYRELGDDEKAVDLLIAAARQCWSDGESQAGIEFAERAIALTRNGAHRNAYATIMLASYLAILGHSEAADEQLQRLAGKRLPPEIAARWHDTRAVVLSHRGDENAATEAFEAAAAEAALVGDADLTVRTLSNRAEFVLASGYVDDALALWETAFCCARDAGYTGRMAYAALGSADVLLKAGRLAEARERLLFASSTGVQHASVRMLQASLGTRLGVMLGDERLRWLGEDSEALEMAFKSMEGPWIGQVVAAVAEAHLVRDEHAAAMRVLERGAAALRVADGAEWMLVLAGIVDTRLGDRAVILLDESARRRPWPAVRAFAQLGRALRTKRKEQGASQARGAADMFARAGWRWFHARALEIAQLPDEARSMYESFGDQASLDRLAGVSRPRADRAGTELTSREREVTALAAEGLSNRAIGERLNISERTVEHHLASAFARLGIRSRWQLTQAG